MMVLDLALDEIAVVIPEKELRQIVADSEMHEKLFLELLIVAMQACGSSARKTTISGMRQEFTKIENWIREHYVELRPTLPQEVKRLYLGEIAFPIKER